MRLGIGGRAFGVRGGISTRGIGVGVGPFSAGTSWRGRRSRGGSGGSAEFWSFLIIAVVVFLVVAWPYLLGTYIAVQCGAWNPSTTRFVVGWCFEVVYVAAFVGVILNAREISARGAAEEAERMAALTASGAVYEAKHGNSVVYRHGTCTTNHKSAQTAQSCTKSAAPTTVGVQRPASTLPVGPETAGTRFSSAITWPAAILAIGLISGLGIALADPIHSPAGDAASKACPTPASFDGSVATVTMPDLVGQNAGSVEARLKHLGLTSVQLSSANPNYKSVWVPSNWTVVSTDPAPGCAVSSYYGVVVYVTK